MVFDKSTIKPISLFKEEAMILAKRIAILGGGPMGLSFAYELSKLGYQVEIFEADDRLGGMTSTFDFEGLNIERFYHFLLFFYILEFKKKTQLSFFSV